MNTFSQLRRVLFIILTCFFSFITLILPLIFAVVAATYAVSDVGGLGLEWEGVGAISGGGATTKLLMDYEPKVR